MVKKKVIPGIKYNLSTNFWDFGHYQWVAITAGTLLCCIYFRLDDRSLASCRRVSKAWKECVDFQRIYWIRKILKYAQNFKALYRHFWNYDGIFNTDVKTVSEHKSTIGLKTVEYSPDSPDSHEESFDNDINNNINSQTQDETHDGIGQNKNSFWHKQG